MELKSDQTFASASKVRYFLENASQNRVRLLSVMRIMMKLPCADFRVSQFFKPDPISIKMPLEKQLKIWGMKPLLVWGMKLRLKLQFKTPSRTSIS